MDLGLKYSMSLLSKLNPHPPKLFCVASWLCLRIDPNFDIVTR